MKIVIFNTLAQATEYFDRDYTELFSRIEDAQALALTIANHTPKPRLDGKYWYPALDGADYTNVNCTVEDVPNAPTPEPTETETETEPTEE